MEDKFKALGHEVRLKIYRALREETLCVCEINQLLDMSQSAVSQHLSQLKNAGLIESEKRKQWIFYSPIQDRFFTVLEALLEPRDQSFSENIESIKKQNLCGLRDEQGCLSKEEAS